MITLSSIAGQKFAVLGLGKSGLAAAAALRDSKAEVTVWDDGAEARQKAEAADFAFADPLHTDLAGYRALILSPGIPYTHPKPHPAVARFHEKNIEVVGDVELLFRACPDATYVGVTGTNGKSTTTALIGHILKQAGREVQVGGNLGIPVLSLKPLSRGGIYVLELSSYQLDLIRQNPISVAVLLNITPDHLDRHGNLAGYIRAKTHILGKTTPQTLIIGNGEAETRAVADAARKQGNIHVEEIHTDRISSIVDPATLPALPGAHNWQNAMAAFMACHALGVSKEDIIKGLQSFPGLEHRQQLVATIASVRFINDSKATNADAASKALGCYENIYWIAGGKPKEGGLSGLESFTPRIRHAFLIGAASDGFAAWCEKNKVAYTRCGTLDVATQKAAAAAWAEAKKDAVVLLSPACASFDQFNNFEERGRKFADLAGRLNPPALKKAQNS